jgi:LytS/YehU family sensor histidine kinase
MMAGLWILFTGWAVAGIFLLIALFALLLRLLVLSIRKQERNKANYEKQLFILQSKALSAQMNPHFIFNCLNSIKSLVQMNENSRAAEYLNMFAKLTRNVMQYSEKFEITLFEELEICRWYLQLETLRFGSKVNVDFDLDERIDTRQVPVPVLLIQPFIENAVCHGLVPMQKDGGLLQVKLAAEGRKIVCTIQDNGIGRAASIRMNGNRAAHQSKGMSLSQERVNLHNQQNENKVNIRITDRFDEMGEPSGTRVSITFSNSNYD